MSMFSILIQGLFWETWLLKKLNLTKLIVTHPQLSYMKNILNKAGVKHNNNLMPLHMNHIQIGIWYWMSYQI